MREVKISIDLPTKTIHTVTLTSASGISITLDSHDEITFYSLHDTDMGNAAHVRVVHIEDITNPCSGSLRNGGVLAKPHKS